MLSRLPIVATVAGAYGAVLGNLGNLIKATLVPLLMLLVLTTIAAEFQRSTIIEFITWLLALPFAALCAIAVHRTVLLGPDSLASPWSLTWSERESSFVIWLIIFAIFGYIVNVAVMAVVWMIPNQTVILVATLALGFWLEGRFGMVLPATALDRNMRFSHSWYLTSGNDIALVVILSFPFVLYFGIVSLLIGAQAVVPPIVTLAASWFLLLLTFAVQVAALSLSYQWLKEESEEA